LKLFKVSQKTTAQPVLMEAVSNCLESDGIMFEGRMDKDSISTEYARNCSISLQTKQV
jgi:hypothetical protein